MDTLARRIWVARLIALVLMGVSLSSLTVFERIKSGPCTHTIDVRVDGNPGEILTALERLDRPDVGIRVKEVSWYLRGLNSWPAIIVAIVSLTVSLGFFLLIYYATYCIVWAIMGRVQRGRTLIEGI